MFITDINVLKVIIAYKWNFDSLKYRHNKYLE
jgi:hypothetical protein